MKEDGESAVPQFRQQPAKALSGAGINLALRHNPLVAASPTRIRIATGQIKYDLGDRCRLDYGWRWLRRFRRRLGQDGRNLPDGGDKHGNND
jgi:hypothetical protein